ncbi:MAG TPA: MgtC/SapB family protein, partial [Terriglobales bacterium]|nr:MgtC/SapB family protein [Terriglobales bacterium]
MNFPEHPALRLGIALGIGLLIGAERERRKGAMRSRSPAGIRTFALTALAGGIAVLVGGELLLAVSAASVAAFSVIAYRRTSHSDPGLTSEMALFATLLLGALAVVHPGPAAGLGVIVTILLAARTRLHRLFRRALTEQEAHDALLFAAASLVVLPLMPNHRVGPYSVLNPRRFWELVVLI